MFVKGNKSATGGGVGALKERIIPVEGCRKGAVIGRGGANVNEIQRKTNTSISVGQTTVDIRGESNETVEIASQAVRDLISSGTSTLIHCSAKVYVG
jgi:rRNA processing protein Krr1/Pno1